jgi:hypothetical protein
MTLLMDIDLPRRKLESEVQAEILCTLRGLNLFVWRNPSGIGGGKRVQYQQGAGLPDIGGILPGGRTLAIEVKRPGARKRKNEAKQNEWLDRARRMGACVVVARSVDDVLAALREEGVIR